MIRTFPLLALTFFALTLTSSYTKASNTTGKLIWTELNTRTKRARINSLPADPSDYISSATVATTAFYESTPAHWIAIASDYDDETIFWTDAARKRIMKGGLGDGATAMTVFTGTSQTVDGIAVDWMANNIYWADGAYDWIILTNYNASSFKVLIDTEMDKPRGLTLYPQRGYLFWSDWGDSQKIERSDLAGENRTIISDTGLHYPNGLAVDFAEDMLYWVDADPTGSRLERCNLNGENRKTVFSVAQSQGHLFDLAIFGDYIFISDWHEMMRCIKKSDEEQFFALNVGARPFGVTVYSHEVVHGTQSPCDSSPCQHLCVSDAINGYKCLCQDNYRLLDDGHSCELETIGLIMPQVLMIAKNSLCNFPANFADMVIAPDSSVTCFLSNRTFSVAVGIDTYSRLLFYSDFEKKTIERVRLLQGEVVDTIQAGVGSVEGIAVDWLTQNIYWTDAGYNHIAVSRYDGQNRNIVIKDNVIKPRSIALHPGERLMFWTEFGPPGHIERAGMDGKNREIIVTGAAALNGLTIDFAASRLYYGDRESGSINTVDFDGTNKRTLYTRVGAQYFDMDIFKDYFIWTEWNSFNGIHAINRENGRVTQSLRIGTPVYGIKIYAKERQPVWPIECGTDNGGCDHLCLPSMNGGYSCACGTGFTLTSNGTCETRISTDNFILATDSYLHGIVQMYVDPSDSSLGYTALDLGPMTNPIAVDYDPVEMRVYWSDVKEQKIHRAFLNGTGREVVAGPEDGVRIPDGIAIDRVSRLIYWTDADTNSTSVARLDGSRRKTLFSENLEKPRAIALDIANGYMYWSDWGNIPKIERSYMNGTNRETIIDTDLGWPNGITLDLAENQIYWCDAQTNKIERSDLNGENRQVVVDFGDVGHESHTFGIAIYGQYVYWTDWTLRAILRANKTDGSNNGTVGMKDFVRLNSLRYYNSAEDINNTVCSGANGCSSLCLPTPDGPVCACKDGDSLSPDGKTCWFDMNCPRQIRNGNITTDCNPDGACAVACDIGYQLGATDMRVKCITETGQWDIDTTNLCQVVTCNSLPEIPDVIQSVCPMPYTYGATCTYSCLEGFEVLQGDKVRTCQGDGQWSGSDLRCTLVTCDPLEVPEYGTFSNMTCSTIGGSYGDICLVICQDGFQLTGVIERACLATGEWQDADANSTCVDITAPVFNSSCEDVRVRAERGQVTANVTYERPSAYDNSGKPVTIWARRDEYLEPPIEKGADDIMTFYAIDHNHNTAGCTFVVEVEVLRCPELANPPNGFYTDCQTHWGSTCEAQCDEGYYLLDGDAKRVCELNATDVPYWTGEVPICQQAECQEVDDVDQSQVLKGGCGTSPYPYGTTCLFRCLPGFRKVGGSTVRECNKNSEWTGQPIVCEVQYCMPVEEFQNGIIDPLSCTTHNKRYNDVCNITCKEGFRLVGASEHRCLATGQWSNNAEDSHLCVDARKPHFNNTCPSDFTVYAQEGEDDAIAMWSYVVFDHGPVVVTSSKGNGTRFAEGTHTIMVTATDETGNVGICEFSIQVIVIRCVIDSYTRLSLENNFDTHICHDHYGSECSFTCREGYRLVGNSSVTCLWDQTEGTPGHWSDEFPTCEAITCSPLNSYLEDTPYEVKRRLFCAAESTASYNTKCFLSCRTGYVSGSISISGIYTQCAGNGNWTLPDDACIPETCDAVHNVDPNLIRTPPGCLTRRGSFGDECSLSCPEGYELRSPRSVYYCNDEGRWSTDELSLQSILRPFIGPWGGFLPDIIKKDGFLSEETRCIDIQKPVFDDGPCPRTTTLTIEPCKNSSTLLVTKPQATDNSEEPVTVLGPDNSTRELSVGEHTFSYTAYDADNNYAFCNVTIIVRMVQCPPLPYANDFESLSCGYHYGSVASYRCPEGQRSSSTSQPVMCGIAGQWMGLVPECEDITCDPLSTRMHMSFVPPKCTQVPITMGSSCFAVCDTGYGYKGESKHQCLEDGTWSREIGECLDIEVPVFTTCPNGKDVDLDIGQNQTSFNWPVPEATDNSGDTPIIKNAEGLEPPLTMGPGQRIVQYVATDMSGNSMYCVFTVTVHDIEPPVVLECPQPIVRQVSVIPLEVTWIEPLFRDNIAVTVVTKTAEPGLKIYSWGRTTVTYTARDKAGNEAQCMVFIDVVDSTSCLPLQPPTNGALSCANDHCAIHCNSGYMFTEKNKPQGTYVCLDNGYWDTGNGMERAPNLPACSEVSMDKPVTWQRKDKVQFELHHLNGNCQDIEQQIQEKFSQLLQSSAFLEYCRQDPKNDCKVNNINVQCGETVKPGRRRRQVPETQPADEDQDELLSLIYSLFGQRNSSEDISNLLASLNMSISDVFGADNVTFTINGDQVMLSSQDQKPGQIDVTCEVNQTLASDGLHCIDCPAGTRYSLTLGDCMQCPKGQYQGMAGQMSCTMCPQYMSTMAQGATDVSLCIAMCPPGRYSPSGLEACQECPRGTHQQNRGQRGCNPCPEGMTTRNDGATTYTQCIAKKPVEPVVTPPTNIGSATPSIQTQSTQTITSSPGSVDVKSTSSSVVVTMVTKPNKDVEFLTSPASTSKLSNPDKLTNSKLPLPILIGAAVGLVVLVIIIIIGVICFRRRCNSPYGGGPLSWHGSERGSILKNVDDDDDFDGSIQPGGYQQLETQPEYAHTGSVADKRYNAANYISNPTFESTFASDDRKGSIALDESFGDNFHIFSPSGPLDSVELE